MRKRASGSPKVFLYGYYGYSNVGDDLLLSSVISAISKFAPNARFVVRSLNPVASVTDDRIQYVALERLIIRAGRSRWYRLARYAWATWCSLRGCSHLVFGGGTLFHARARSNVSLALIAMLVVMARLRGAKVFALGVGVAPLPKGMPQYLMGGVLTLAQDFAVRDVSSVANCRNLWGVTHVRCTADIVFALSLEKSSRAARSRPVLGITLAASDIGYEGSGNADFLASLASALERLQELGWEVCFLSFQELDLGGIKLSDTALFDVMVGYGMGQAMTRVWVSSHPVEIARQFSNIDVVAGMRFHGHVLAALLDIPFVGFGRDSKVQDLCEYFSMPFLAMNDLQEDRLVAAVAQSRGQVPSREKVFTLAHAAMENFRSIGASIL